MDEIAYETEHSNQSVAMFQAVKKIRNPKASGNIIVHNNKGEIIINKKQQYERIKKYFQSQFWNQTHKVLEKYDGEPRPLNQPISLDEV